MQEGDRGGKPMRSRLARLRQFATRRRFDANEIGANVCYQKNYERPLLANSVEELDLWVRFLVGQQRFRLHS